jgi:hypothetical protein
MSPAKHLRLFGVLAIAGVSLVSACGSSSKSSNSASDSSTTAAASTDTKAAFCADNDAISKALSGIRSEAEIVPALKANISSIDQFGKDAPASVKADAKVMVDASHTAIDKNDASSLSAAPFTAASTKVDTFCGVSSSTTTTAKP